MASPTVINMKKNMENYRENIWVAKFILNNIPFDSKEMTLSAEYIVEACDNYKISDKIELRKECETNNTSMLYSLLSGI